MNIFWTYLLPIISIGSAFILYKLFYVWNKEGFKKYKNQKTFPTSTTLKKELHYTVKSIVVLILIGLLMDYLLYTKPFLLFHQFLANNVLSFIISFIILILWQDTYFYWLHRMLHLNWFYNKVHYHHHKFLNPTPITTLAAHPLEIFLQLVHLPLIISILPISSLALTVFVSIMILSSTFGHLGYEMRPHSVLKRPIVKHLITTTHHNQHHQDDRFNFGFYLDFWDTVMRTKSPKYYDKFTED